MRVLVLLLAFAVWQAQAPSPPPDDAQLQPTIHAALPENADDYWFAPRPADSTARLPTLTDAAAAYAAGNYTSSLSLARQAAATNGPLAVYAQYYIGLSQLKLSNAADADKAFDAVLARKPEGYLSIAALLGKGQAAEIRSDHASAAGIYEKLSTHKAVVPEDGLARLARTSLAMGNRARAAEAYLRIYYEFPLTDAAATAAVALKSLQDVVVRENYKLDLGRALILFGAKRYGDAKSELLTLQRQATGDDREVIDLRIAESEFFLKRYAYARDGVRPYLENASRKAEAKFFYLSALRELGDADQAVELTRALVNEFPESSWSAEALNNLGTYYIVTNQDDLAAQAFRELFEKFPSGPHTERAAWKYGWWAYTTGKFAETARVFEAAAAAFPRSDYRPPWLYWSGRAREQLGQRESADARMRLVHADYLNSYYGRLAARRLPASEAVNANNGAKVSLVPAAVQPVAPAAPAPPPSAPLIRQMLAAGLYDDALDELRFAQRAWGSSPAVEATQAFVYYQKGELVRARTVMRRAYPQYLTAGGEALPAAILQIMFPLTYWDAIKKNAAIHGLDPYVVAALIAQESMFDPRARSSANAWGLMQSVPSTGRRLASALGIRRFTTAMLTNGETNIRLGTLYFKRLVSQFGGVHYALASYTAVDNRVVRWKAERPGMDEDEFIDDIPFPETQNYVKRILGSAEDYRRLYGEGEGEPRPTPTVKPSTSSRTSSSAKKSSAKKPTTTRKTTAKPPAKKTIKKR
jgi:soluble lytic murein transglycosylase